MSERVFDAIHITKDEYKCPCCGKLPRDLYTDDRYFQFFQKFEVIRSDWGKAIPISKGGGYRCPSYQYSLVMNQKTNAVLSPHFFFALDLDVDTEQEVHDLVQVIIANYSKMRIGYMSYLDLGKTFVHIDEAYLIKPQPTFWWKESHRW